MTINDDKKWVMALFGVIVLGTALGNLSQTGLNAMMIAICDDFSIETSIGQWLTTAYMLVLGITVPLIAFLMSVFTSRNLTAFALTLFAGGCVVSALAPNFHVLLFGRIIQAAATGILMPFLMTFVMIRFPAGKKATAMGIAGIALGFAPNIGPTIGGALVGVWGWRSFFWGLALVAGLFALICAVCIQSRRDKMPEHKLDIISFMEIALAFSCILTGMSQAAIAPLTSFFVWGAVLLGCVLLAMFWARQLKLTHPLINVHIFQNRTFVSGFWVLNLLFASFLGVTLLIPLFVEGVQGGSALDAGLVMLPATLVALFMNPLAGILTDKIGVRPVVLVSACFLCIGSIAMVFCWKSEPFWLLVLLQTIRSIGVSGLIPALSSWHLSMLQPKLVSSGSAASFLGRQVFASFGTALMMMCVSSMSTVNEIHAFQCAFDVSAIFAVICAVYAFFRVRK